MASKILKQAQTDVIPEHDSMPQRAPQRAMLTDEQIDAILQARLKQINNKHLTSDEL